MALHRRVVSDLIKRLSTFARLGIRIFLFFPVPYLTVITKAIRHLHFPNLKPYCSKDTCWICMFLHQKLWKVVTDHNQKFGFSKFFCCRKSCEALWKTPHFWKHTDRLWIFRLATACKFCILMWLNSWSNKIQLHLILLPKASRVSSTSFCQKVSLPCRFFSI